MASKLISGLLLTALFLATPVSSQDFLLSGWASVIESSAGIHKYFPATGRWQKLPISGVYIPLAVTYDPIRERVIWSDGLVDAVMSANVDGTNKRTVTKLEDDDIAVRGLQYDWSTGLLFYTRQKNSASGSGGKLIVRDMESGKEVELLSLPLHAPSEISLDHNDKNIFYANPLFSRVELANFDITNRTAFLTSRHVRIPTALHYDDDNQYLYTCDFLGRNDNVTKCTRWTWNTGGLSHSIQMSQTRVSYVEGVDDKLYFSDSIKEELREVTLGPGARSKRVTGQPLLAIPTGLYYHRENYRTYDNPCERARCGRDELCIPTSRYEYSCNCTIGATCKPVREDECERDDHGCQHHCVDTHDSYYCTCRTGHRLLSDGRSCQDVDECAAGSHTCGQGCSNTEGSFMCSCRGGFRLAPNRRDCIPVTTTSTTTTTTEAPAPALPSVDLFPPFPVPGSSSGTASDCHGPDLSSPDLFSDTYEVERGLVYTGAPLKAGTIRAVRFVGVGRGPVSLAVFTSDPVSGTAEQTVRSLTPLAITSTGLQTLPVDITVEDSDRLGLVFDRPGVVPIGVASYSGFNTDVAFPLTTGDSVSFDTNSGRVFALNFCYEF